MPERRAGPASSPALPATSLTLELVEAVHGPALASSAGAACATPQAKIAAMARSERSGRCCEKRVCMSTSENDLAANLAAGGLRCDAKTNKMPHAFVSANARKRHAYPNPAKTLPNQRNCCTLVACQREAHQIAPEGPVISTANCSSPCPPWAIRALPVR